MARPQISDSNNHKVAIFVGYLFDWTTDVAMEFMLMLEAEIATFGVPRDYITWFEGGLRAEDGVMLTFWRGLKIAEKLK